MPVSVSLLTLVQHLTPLAPDPEDPQVAGEVQAMPHTDFLALLRALYARLQRCVEGVQVQNVMIAELLQDPARYDASVLALLVLIVRRPVAEAPDATAAQEDLAELLTAAAELANANAAKVVALRAEQHTTLELPEFVDVFDASWAFVVRCEVLCRRMIVGLRGTIVSQAKAFLQAFHQSRLSQSAKLVEDELWNPAEVPVHTQHLVDLMLDAAVRDPPELSLKHTPAAAANGTAPPTPNGAVLPAPDGADAAEAPKPAVTPATAKHVRIEERTYFGVGATLRSLELLADYLRLVRALDTLTPDAMARTVEFLKAFNSRTCQVVLGAGAMRSAGLKNITAKHLGARASDVCVLVCC
jgi:vacuolar protein sorting-associated protein 54